MTQKTLGDKEVRCILVAGKTNEHLVKLIYYYYTSMLLIMLKCCFFYNVLSSLIPHFMGYVIFGEDTNIPFDQSLDKSVWTKSVLKHSPKTAK